jgi:hypothetical protein
MRTLRSLLAAPALLLPRRETSLDFSFREGRVPRRLRFRDVAFTYAMPGGIPGDVNRAWASTILPVPLDTAANSKAFGAYGLPGVIDAADLAFRPVQAADTLALLFGVLVRPFPTNQQSSSSFFAQNRLPPTDTQQPPQNGGQGDCLKRGFVTVLLSTGSVASVYGGQVYVRVANAGAGKAIGGWEAAADGGNTIAPLNTFFMGPADSNGNVEIGFNI